MVFICISLMTSDIEYFFHVPIGHLFISSLEKCVFDSFAHFLIRLFLCLMLNFTSYLYMLNSNLLLIIYKFFSHSVNCLFILVYSFYSINNNFLDVIYCLTAMNLGSVLLNSTQLYVSRLCAK